MANIKILRKIFEKEIKPLTKELEEQIALFGTPVESVTQEEIELEIFPNRPDLLSTQGFLRSFKTFIGKEKGLKTYKLNKPQKDYKVIIKPSVKEVRPYTACAIVKNLKFNDDKIKEIVDIQEKLHTTIGRNRKKVAIGIYPLEKISLPITYEAKKPDEIKFLPLEAKKEMTGRQILQRHPTGRDYAHLLENASLYPIFTDSKNKILSMPPIINSHETGKITEQTKEVFVECSGHNQETLNKVLNIVITTLIEQGGQAYQMDLGKFKTPMSAKPGRYSAKPIPLLTPDLSTEKLSVSLENTNKLLGLELKESDLARLLPKMGYNYKSGKVEIPAWRTDILHEVDIIEDIAIAYGYNNLQPEIPQVSTVGQESLQSKIKTKLSEILIGLNLLEISTYHLIKPNETNEKNLIELEDSKTEHKILRSSLLEPTLRTLTENKDNEYPQNLFEIGTVFSKNPETETGIKETENLIISLTPGNFTQIKQILDNFTQTLDINYKLEESIHPNLIEGRTAKILINEKPIGYLGELHPNTLKKWGIKMPGAIAEISLEEIFKILKD